MSEDLGAEPWRLGVGQVLHPLIDPAMSTAATIGTCDPNFSRISPCLLKANKVCPALFRMALTVRSQYGLEIAIVR
jgi:hypothetical protein